MKGTFTYLILCPSLGDGKLTLRHLSLGDGKLTLRLRQRRLGHQDLQWVTGGQRLRDYQIEAVVIMYQIEIVVIMNGTNTKTGTLTVGVGEIRVELVVFTIVLEKLFSISAVILIQCLVYK